MAAIDGISRRFEDSGRITTAMRHIMTKTIVKCKSMCKIDLYNLLVNKRIGTADVNELASKLCKNLSKEKFKCITTTIMKWRLKEERKKFRIKRYEEKTTWADIRKLLVNKENVQLFNAAWADEKFRTMKDLRKVKLKKYKWILFKYKTKETAPDYIEGVCVKNQEIDMDYLPAPKLYGGIMLDGDELAALSLQPKFTAYSKINVTQCEAEIEKSLSNIRRKRIHAKESNGNENNIYVRNLSIYNFETKTIDLQRMRSTDLPFNAMVYLPPPLTQQQEITMLNLKQDLLQVTEQYCAHNDNNMTNLTAQQKRGIEKLVRKSVNGECVIYQTDKSNAFSADSVENYIQASSEHVEKDTVVTKEEHKHREHEFNSHAMFWTNMLNVGKDTGDQARWKMSMKSHNSGYSKLYSLRKDHKECIDNFIGPPVRPICDMSDAFNHRLSHLTNIILAPLADLCATQCDSTEDMLAEIEATNDRNEMGPSTVIGSLDVKSLYPSLDIPFSIEVVCREFDKSGILVDGVDYMELGLYISLNRKTEYINTVGLEDYCPKRRIGTGRPPTMTASGSKPKKEERWEPWKVPRVPPEGGTKKTMFREALKIVLELILQNHIYVFNNEIRKQVEGGPIGMDLTGVVAKIVMAWWDREMLKLLRENNMRVHLYKRYVDDINISVDMLEPGTRYVDGILQIKADYIETDIQIPGDERTLKEIKKIGETIHESIKLETDSPSQNTDKKLPILDLKVWIENDITSDRYKIMHEHYIKDVSSQLLTHANSAIAWKDKRTILTQMGLRVLLNCSVDLSKETVSQHLSNFNKRMQLSGYNHRFRFEITKSVFKAYSNILKQQESGIRPLYRKRDYMIVERKKDKQAKKNSWYTRNNYESVIFVPATPNSKLSKSFRQKINESGIKIRVVEKSGRKVKNLLQRNDPLSDQHCQERDCFVCSTSNKGNCRTTGITYRISCTAVNCQFRYNGQTSQNGYSRGGEHLDDYRLKKDKTVMWEHCQQQHTGIQQTFSMEVVDKCRNDPTKRQILEGIHIQNTNPLESMNMRNEWNSAQVPRITVTT